MLSAFVALGTLAGIAFSLALFFLPALVAKSRRHPNLLAIFLVNLFFGWTFVQFSMRRYIPWSWPHLINRRLRIPP